MKNFAFRLTILSLPLAGCITMSQKESPAGIKVQPADLSITEGDTATITVIATGTHLSYQWIKNNTDTMAGDTMPALILPSVAPSDDGATYKCRIRNAVNVVVSNSAVLKVAWLSIPDSVPMTEVVNPVIPAFMDTGAVRILFDTGSSEYFKDPQTLYFNGSRDTMRFVYESYFDELKLARSMFSNGFRVGRDSSGNYQVRGDVTAYYNDGIMFSPVTKYSLGSRVVIPGGLPKGRYKVYVKVNISCYCFPNPPAKYFYAEFAVGKP